MDKETITDVYFSDTEMFGDDKEHYYDVECFDGHAIATRSEYYEDHKAPYKLKVTYPKREDVLIDHYKVKEVLEYRGLYDLTADDITFSDIMLRYGKLEKVS